MSYYYKVPKDSPTGEKFKLITDKIETSEHQISEFLKQFETTSYRPYNNPFLVIGGKLTSIVDAKNTEGLKMYKGIANEFEPDSRTQKGKELIAKMNLFEKVSKEELNECVGIELNEVSSIGFQIGDEYYGFEVSETQSNKAKFVPPSDCIEITLTEYKKLQAE